MSISTFDLTEYDPEHGYGPEDTNDTQAPPPPATDPHEPKESRPVPTREEFENALNHYCVLAVQCGRRPSAEAAAACVRQEELLEAAFDAVSTERDGWKRRAEKVYSYTEALKLSRDRLTAERDEWKRRAGAAEAERDAARAENAELNELFELQGRRLSDATKRWQAVTGEHGTLPDLGALLAWLLGEIDKANATDPRIAAWRALDAEQRSYRVEDLRTWADLVEAGAAPDGADHGPSPLRIAAAALEALGEKP